MGPAVGAPVMKRRQGGNLSAELLERKLVDKVNLGKRGQLRTAGSGSEVLLFLC